MIGCLILVPFLLLTMWAIDVYIERKRAKEDPYPDYLKLVNKKPTKK
jgi:hypothetical protein